VDMIEDDLTIPLDESSTLTKRRSSGCPHSGAVHGMISAPGVLAA
jgi:hypothetical protein